MKTKIDIETIPGAYLVEGREHRYIQANHIKGGKTFDDKYFFPFVDSIEPCSATDGAIITERCKIITPDENIFYGLSYRGNSEDLKNWGKDIKQGAEIHHSLYAWIDPEKKLFCISNGDEFPLEQCVVELY